MLKKKKPNKTLPKNKIHFKKTRNVPAEFRTKTTSPKKTLEEKSYTESGLYFVKTEMKVFFLIFQEIGHV